MKDENKPTTGLQLIVFILLRRFKCALDPSAFILCITERK